MKKLQMATLLTVMVGLAACGSGPSAEEKAAADQAKLDSIKAAEQAKLDAMAAEAAAAEAAAYEAGKADAEAEAKEAEEEKEQPSVGKMEAKRKKVEVKAGAIKLQGKLNTDKKEEPTKPATDVGGKK